MEGQGDSIKGGDGCSGVVLLCSHKPLPISSYEELLQDSEEEGKELYPGKMRGQTSGHRTSAGKSRQAGSWIKESGGDDPLNFLDPSIARRITCEWVWLL